MRWRFTDKALFFSPWAAILTLKAGTLEEYSLLERWGEPGRAPAAFLLESCFQSARWLVEASSAFALSCAPVEVAHWRALPGPRPGERFCAFLRVTGRDSAQIRFALRQKILAPGEDAPAPDAWPAVGEDDGRFTCAFTPLSAWDSPADRACLWQEIGA
ncbi:MAG: hypothetical protein LBI59_11950 [Candidatus Accumulibacter sp.]|nr:hypothetical protein [Accumulibacter sp.]